MEKRNELRGSDKSYAFRIAEAQNKFSVLREESKVEQARTTAHFLDEKFTLPAYSSARYDAATMESLDQFMATYAGMTEAELAEAASHAYDLTDEAQQALRWEISRRGLNISVAEPAIEDDENEDEDDDSGPVVVASLRSRNDAAKIQAVLNAAAVRSCLGPNNIENIESFPGTFDKPVELKVYLPYASKASNLIRKLKNSIPPEFENDVQVEDDKAHDGNSALVPCPKCQSDDIVYSQDFDDGDFEVEDSSSDEEVPEGLREGATPSWRCKSCGYEWPDDDTQQW